MTLTEDFAARREERLRKKWSLWQPRNPNPSDITDCRRHQVFRVMCWEMRPLPDVAGMEAMEDGQLAERHVIDQLREEGWQIVMEQAPFEILQPLHKDGPRLRIVSGKIDGKVKLKGMMPPLEVKTTSEWTFNSINEAADLLNSPWQRKWYRQLQLYCLGENSDFVLLVVAFRGKRKVMEVELDYYYAEALLQDLIWAVDTTIKLQTWETPPEDVDRALLETYDEPHHDDYNACRICPWKDVACFPAEPSMQTAQTRNDLGPIVARYLEVKPLSAEAEKLRKQIKVATEGFPQTVAGEYIIEGKVKTRRMKEKPARGAYVSEYWDFDARKVGEK